VSDLQLYDSCYVTIDGEPIGTPVDAVRVETHASYGVDMSAFRPEPLNVSIECTVPLDGRLDEFASLYRREPPGASYATLARRARYGGRKGRRALQRMLARVLPIEVEISPDLSV
jgi:hypothetical protein